MRKILAAFIFLVVSLSAFCEVPELQKILPTEWKLMTKLSEENQKKIADSQKQVISEIYGSLDPDSYLTYKLPYDISSTQNVEIYNEKTGTDVFYWLFLKRKTNNSPYAFYFGRIVNKKLQILAGAEFRKITIDPTADGMLNCQTISIIRNKNGMKGYLVSGGGIECNADGIVLTGKCKGQYRGMCSGDYFLLSDISDSFQYYRDWNDIQSIKISASDFLWDKDNPLKYGLQNAFDGDPATSYVENTDDDLMRIEVHIPLYNPKIAIINGYAQNSSLYKSNNRIKLFNYNYVLSDNQLDYQIQECEGNDYLIVKKIYSGEKYNDTCVAELNFWHQDTGWLFGDIHE